ncbi:CBS domain-containing protein [Planomonospora corallina]|uniref:CBS domain-containing protein n=1 Tax=Planomonospora corallina TaxID=1806052 RepID=A0ABV8ID12_9ACTN
MGTQVRDVMGRVAIAVPLNAPFTEIIAVMRRFAVGAVAVVDSDRRPVGVVSQDDLLLKETDRVRHSVSIYDGHRQRQEHRKAAGVVAAELMTAPAVTVTPGTPVREAARLMHDRRVRQLPVIDPVTGRMVGTVHQVDLLKVFTRSPERLRAEVEEVIRAEVGVDPAALSVSVADGVVTVGGVVERSSLAAHLVEAVRRSEGVVGVVSELTWARDDVLAARAL